MFSVKYLFLNFKASFLTINFIVEGRKISVRNSFLFLFRECKLEQGSTFDFSLREADVAGTLRIGLQMCEIDGFVDTVRIAPDHTIGASRQCGCGEKVQKFFVVQ